MSEQTSDASASASPLILPHQRSAYASLLATGRACFAVDRSTLPLKLRTNTLVLGPTGSGKTHLVRKVAEELCAGCLCLNVSSWMILGAADKSSSVTWPTIVYFLYYHRSSPGVVIFVDEIDKIYSASTSTWSIHQRLELFMLLDGMVPPGLKDGEGHQLGKDVLVGARETLANRTLIVGAGAFQDLWDSSTKPSIGFSESEPKSDALDSTQMSEVIPKEIVNRFCATHLVLPPPSGEMTI